MPPVAREVEVRPAKQSRSAMWRRAATGVSMVVVAFVSAIVTVQALASPQEVAVHAEAGDAATPAASPALSPAQEQTGLQQLLNSFVSSHTGGPYDIVVQDLHSGAGAGIDPDRSFLSASLYKLFVADQIYHMIDTGNLSYGAAAGGGTNNTIRGCLDLMITISDNTCGQALGRILDWGAQNPALAAQGFGETDLTTPQQTSARDVALLFEKLYNGTLDSAASNAAFLTLLKNQEINDRLPQGLPPGTVIAHKTGNLDNVVHDAGIVYGPKTDYLVVVMSGPWVQPANAPAQMAGLSKQLWQFFEP